MGTGYRIAYRLGLTPWERAGPEAAEHFDRLLRRETAERAAPPGRALDLGCGTGAHTVELAARGWQATGVDNVARALAQARRRTTPSGVTFVAGDVTDLAAAGLVPGFDFFLDIGCFHGLGDDDRVAMARSVTAMATDTATQMVLAFHPGRRIGLPRGASRQDLERAYLTWRVVESQPAETSGMPGPLKRTAPAWFRLARR